MDIRLTAAELESLRWYLDRANHGRGRLQKDSVRLVKLGLLRLAWTSMNCWVLTLSRQGKAFLEGQ